MALNQSINQSIQSILLFILFHFFSPNVGDVILRPIHSSRHNHHNRREFIVFSQEVLHLGGSFRRWWHRKDKRQRQRELLIFACARLFGVFFFFFLFFFCSCSSSSSLINYYRVGSFHMGDSMLLLLLSLNKRCLFGSLCCKVLQICDAGRIAVAGVALNS